jgi:hypothetical protein
MNSRWRSGAQLFQDDRVILAKLSHFLLFALPSSHSGEHHQRVIGAMEAMGLSSLFRTCHS